MTKKESMRRWYLANKEKQLAKRKLYYEANKDRQKKTSKDWRISNKEKQVTYQYKWKEKNKDKVNEYAKIQCRAWYQKNKKKKLAAVTKRKADKLKRTPKWADLKAICEFYKNCPSGYHVDHLIPLKGKTVSGLHVLENLQYLSASENLKKSNKFK